jgi:ribosomal protein S18 acetylase RimI-like enzyme
MQTIMASFPQVLIRNATREDYKGVRSVFIEENRFHAELVPDMIQATDGVLSLRELADFIEDANHKLFVAEQDSDIVGAALVSLRVSPALPWLKSRQFAFIEDIAVKEGCGGQGIGRRMLEHILDTYARAGIHEIELHVWQQNEGAIRFYESNQFRIIQHRMIRTLSKEIETGT